MANPNLLRCDGCGQPADGAHLGRRFQRLEWATRYRPIHIHTLLLGGVSPIEDAEFFYAPEGDFCGEAQGVAEAAGVSVDGKTRETVQVELQRAGFFLAHALECPWDASSQTGIALARAIAARAASVVTRIRRSLKPRRVALVSQLLAPCSERFSAEQLECPVVLDGGKPFAVDGPNAISAIARLRQALAASPAVAR